MRVYPPTQTKSNWLIVFAFFAITVPVIFYIYKFGSLHLSNSKEQWAQFGDFLGGTINPVLTFLTVVLLLRTIKIQSEELKATREELKKTSEAQAKSSEALTKQNDFTETQLKSLITNEKKNDINQLIAIIDKNVEDLLQKKITGPLAETKASATNVIDIFNNRVSETEALFNNLKSHHKSIETLYLLLEEYKKLCEHVAEFDQLAGHTYVSEYYSFRYRKLEQFKELCSEAIQNELKRTR